MLCWQEQMGGNMVEGCHDRETQDKKANDKYQDQRAIINCTARQFNHHVPSVELHCGGIL